MPKVTFMPSGQTVEVVHQPRARLDLVQGCVEVGRFLGDLFGPNRFAEINRLLPEPPRLHEKLRSLEVEYLLIVPRKQSLTLAEDGKLGDYFTVVARSDHYLLIRCHE